MKNMQTQKNTYNAKNITQIFFFKLQKTESEIFVFFVITFVPTKIQCLAHITALVLVQNPFPKMSIAKLHSVLAVALLFISLIFSNMCRTLG